MYDYLIVGTGLAGSVFAQQMLDRGKTVRMLEQRYHIGGNIYDSPMRGINVHQYGVHIFHTSNKAIVDYVKQFGDFRNIQFQVKALYQDRLYTSPFTMQTFQEVWGINDPNEAKQKIIEDSVANDNPTVEGYALRTIGKTLYEMFVKDQMLKHWGIKASKLPESYLKRIPLRFNWNSRYFEDDYEMICESYAQMIMNMIKGADVEVGVDYLSNKEKYSNLARRVVYTGEIDRYFNYVYGSLPYRSLSFSYKFRPTILEADMIRYADSVNPAYRTIDYGRLARKIKDTVVSTETAFDYNPGTGVPMYPVHADGAVQAYAKYQKFAQSVSNTIFIGRLARFQYLDMHQVIGMSLKAAREEIEAW